MREPQLFTSDSCEESAGHSPAMSSGQDDWDNEVAPNIPPTDVLGDLGETSTRDVLAGNISHPVAT